MDRLPEAARGEPITAERHWNPLRRLLERLRIVTEPGSGLGSEETPSGTRVWVEGAPPFPIKITAVAGGLYSWTAQKATTGGGWGDLPGPTGTATKDPARNQAPGAAALDQIVLAWREPSTGRLYFVSDICP